MSLFSRFFYRRPPDGLLEVVDRVYVFDSCFSTEVLREGMYHIYLHEIITELHEEYSCSSFLVFNFREGEKRSQFAEILCEHDVTVLDYPRQYEGCPLLPLSLIQHFLHVCENWLSIGNHQNIILLHCERGGWPLLAFLLASFLVFKKLHISEQRILEIVHREAPKGLLQLLSPLNPLPSQLRYLHYVVRRNISPEWPPSERALSLDCLILRAIPSFDSHSGCRPMIRIFGRNLLSKDGLSTQMLFSLPKKNKALRHYRQVECDVIKIDIQCLVKGDVVLECLHVDLDSEREIMMFRIMFNTAFIRSNILMLNSEDLDILWDSKERYPKGFRAEVLFAEVESISPHRAPIVTLNGEEKGGLPIEAFSRVQELFSGVEWVDNDEDAALWLIKQISANALQDKIEKLILTDVSELSRLQSKVSVETSPTDSEEEKNNSKIARMNLIESETSPDAELAATPCMNSLNDSVAQDIELKDVTFPQDFVSPPSVFPTRDSESSPVCFVLPHFLSDGTPATDSAPPNLPQPPRLCLSAQLETLEDNADNTTKLLQSPSPPLPAIKNGFTSDSSAPRPLGGVTTPPSPPLRITNCVQSTMTPFFTVSGGQPPPPPPPPPLHCVSLEVPATSHSSTSLIRAPPPPPLPLLSYSGRDAQTSVTLQTSISDVNPLLPPLPLSSISCKDVSLTPSTPASLVSGRGSPPLQSPPMPPPPPPSPPSLSTSTRGLSPPPSGGVTYRCTPPLPPPPPKIASNNPYVRLPPPPPVGSRQGPPPPPPPPSSSSSFSHQPRPLHNSYNNVPLPPPPPFSSGSLRASSNNPMHGAPPPPPPPPLASGGSTPPVPPPPPMVPARQVSIPPLPSQAKGPPPPPPPDGKCFSVPPPPQSIGRGRASSVPVSVSHGRGRGAPNAAKKASLKPLHWVKVTRAMQGSLWADSQRQENESRAPEIDISELESLFSANSDGSGKDIGGIRRGSNINKPEKVQLVELRRAYNCEIMLTKIKMPLPDMINAVLALDTSALDIDQVENLIKFCPTKEEMETLKNYTGNKEMLGRCEQFFLELMKVPRVESKLRVFSFRINFSTQVKELGSNLITINSASKEVRESVKLRQVMQTILTLGNALNQGTTRGSAIGFKLDSLLKLSDTRARNNKLTLMHYLCKLLAEKMPELLDFDKDLVHLEAASKIQLKSLAEEMQAVSKGLEKVEQELTTSENDGAISTGFQKALKNFLDTAEAEVRSLISLYSEVGRNADCLSQYFGEDPARCPFEQVTSILVIFIRMFNKSREENAKQADAERKKLEKDAMKERAISSAK